MSYVIWLGWVLFSLNARADITLCLCWRPDGYVGKGKGPRGLDLVPRARALPSKVFSRTGASPPSNSSLDLETDALQGGMPGAVGVSPLGTKKSQLIHQLYGEHLLAHVPLFLVKTMRA